VHDLVLTGVPAGAFHTNTRPDHTITREEIHDTGGLERDEVFLQIARAIALVRMRRVFPFGVPNQIPGTAEAWTQYAVRQDR
jgi:hypothetical protein